MKRGEDELLSNNAQPIYIDPDKALSGIRKIEELFGKLEGDISICDPYFAGATLDYIALCNQASSVRLLTENVQDSSRTKRDLVAFRKEHSVPLEIRVSLPGKLHDRYVLHRGGMILIGTSIKDIGKKQSMLVQLSESFAAEIARTFDREWNRAATFK